MNNMTRFSNYAKIIEPNSEYYGQVFEVSIIGIHEEVIYLKNKAHKFHFSDIQFCVTKDNKPVKIGEEYVCIGDLVNGMPIIDCLVCDVMTFVFEKGTCYFDGNWGDEFESLHPTNKVKITAEGKEYWISREALETIKNNK
jgi:hypothetical protein